MSGPGEPAGHPRSAVKKLVPVIKIAVAVGLIGFLLWFVPFHDRLELPAAAERPAQQIRGSIVERADATARFRETDRGAEYALHFDAGGDVDRVTGPNGALWTLQKPDDPRAKLEPGLNSTVSNASVPLLLLALALLMLGTMVAVYRWFLLLHAADLPTEFGRVFSLTFIGAFFNNIMPGLTGGDLVKAWYIAREHKNRKTEAIITVLLDRLLGITGLALLAGLVIPCDLHRYAEVARWIYGLLLAEMFFGCIFFSRRIRRALHIDGLIARMPLKDVVKKIDEAMFLYRFRRKTLGVSLVLSMVVHAFVVVGIGCIGEAIGFSVPFASYFVVVPIALIVAALPIAPAGWGVGEAAMVYFWRTQGVAEAPALAQSMLYKIEQLLISLIGGVCLAREKVHVSAEEVERFGANDENGVSRGPAA